MHSARFLALLEMTRDVLDNIYIIAFIFVVILFLFVATRQPSTYGKVLQYLRLSTTVPTAKYSDEELSISSDSPFQEIALYG